MPQLNFFNKSFLLLSLGAMIASFQTSVGFGEATDWPQWNGPLRDGHAANQKLLAKWPEGGPKLQWVFKNAGIGYSASSIADGKLYSMGTVDKDCLVFCLDVKRVNHFGSNELTKHQRKATIFTAGAVDLAALRRLSTEKFMC